MSARRMAGDLIARARAAPIEAEAQRRGLKLRGTTDRCGPCPRCGGSDRFSINIRKQVFYCRGCAVGGDVIALVQHLDDCDFTAAIETLTGDEAIPRPIPVRHQSDERSRVHHAADLWRARQPIAGTVAERYLREARGIICPLPATLGFLPAWRDGPPRMIAAFGLCDEPEPGVIVPPSTVEAVHLTFLQPDGTGKADMPNPKQFRGALKGKPIALAPVNDLLGLAITEGIEDALTAFQATGLGAWAAGSATFMPALADTVPDYLEAATIYAHRDVNSEGQRGALALAKKLSQRKIEVSFEGF